MMEFGMGINVLKATEADRAEKRLSTDLIESWVGKAFDELDMIGIPCSKDANGFVLDVIHFLETLKFNPVIVAGNCGYFVNNAGQNSI